MVVVDSRINAWTFFSSMFVYLKLFEYSPSSNLWFTLQAYTKEATREAICQVVFIQYNEQSVH